MAEPATVSVRLEQGGNSALPEFVTLTVIPQDAAATVEYGDAFADIQFQRAAAPVPQGSPKRGRRPRRGQSSPKQPSPKPGPRVRAGDPPRRAQAGPATTSSPPQNQRRQRRQRQRQGPRQGQRQGPRQENTGGGSQLPRASNNADDADWKQKYKAVDSVEVPAVPKTKAQAKPKKPKKDFLQMNKNSASLGSLSRFHTGKQTVEEYREVLEQRERDKKIAAREDKKQKRANWEAHKLRMAQQKELEKQAQIERLEAEDARKQQEQRDRIARVRAAKQSRKRAQAKQAAVAAARIKAEQDATQNHGGGGGGTKDAARWGKMSPAARKNELLRKFELKEQHLRKVSANKERLQAEIVKKKAAEAIMREERLLKSRADMEANRKVLEVKMAKKNAQLMRIREQRFLEEKSRKGGARNSLIARHRADAARQRDTTPGPGAYTLPDFSEQMPGGSFSSAKPKTDVELAMIRSAATPGPGNYTLQDSSTMIAGGTWGKYSPKTELDMIMDRAREIPGPSEYKLPDQATQVTGGTWGKMSSKTDLEVIMERAAAMPGPGQYGVFSEFDQYGNPTLRNKFKNKASELKTKSSFTAFLARQNAHSVQLGQAAVDSDGNPISWDERREQAKRAAEAQRDASEERFREKQVLMMERKLKKDQRREALKQKKAEESLVRAQRRKRADELQQKHRTELMEKMVESNQKIQAIQENKFIADRERRDAEALALIKRHKEAAAKERFTTPGPGNYKLPDSLSATGGTWGKYAPKTELDLIIARAGETPGPAQYVLPDQSTQVTGGTWGKQQVKSDVDILIEQAAQMPGPGQYTLPDQATQVKGGTWGTQEMKSDVDRLVEEAAKTPGPGEYGGFSQFDIKGSPQQARTWQKTMAVHKARGKLQAMLKKQRAKMAGKKR